MRVKPHFVIPLALGALGVSASGCEDDAAGRGVADADRPSDVGAFASLADGGSASGDDALDRPGFLGPDGGYTTEESGYTTDAFGAETSVAPTASCPAVPEHPLLTLGEPIPAERLALIYWGMFRDRRGSVCDDYFEVMSCPENMRVRSQLPGLPYFCDDGDYANGLLALTGDSGEILTRPDELRRYLGPIDNVSKAIVWMTPLWLTPSCARAMDGYVEIRGVKRVRECPFLHAETVDHVYPTGETQEKFRRIIESDDDGQCE